MIDAYCPFFKQEDRNMTCRQEKCALYQKGQCAINIIASSLQKLSQPNKL
ncbi:hypothetical protein Ga0466249_004333 [Sporomusaceae bacterium BoRhaA]|nr:hypothetical protein [Pelorhabdus rhamnosifermentans]MBU2703197.1 hypothetical protein [Pelorhabdus rhamnosifermentans]